MCKEFSQKNFKIMTPFSIWTVSLGEDRVVCFKYIYIYV